MFPSLWIICFDYLAPDSASFVIRISEHAQSKQQRVLPDTWGMAPGKDGVRQLDILSKGTRRVVATADRVCCGYDGAAGLQGGHNAGLGDGDALLLHGL